MLFLRSLFFFSLFLSSCEEKTREFRRTLFLARQEARRIQTWQNRWKEDQREEGKGGGEEVGKEYVPFAHTEPRSPRHDRNSFADNTLARHAASAPTLPDMKQSLRIRAVTPADRMDLCKECEIEL